MSRDRRVPFLLLLALSAVVAACGTRETARDGEPISMASPHPSAQVTHGWLNPKTLQVHPPTVAPDEGDMVLAGLLTGWEFVPLADVVGPLHQPPEDTTTSRAYLQLSRRTVYTEEEGAPSPPYLPGRFDRENRLFYPSQTRVVVQPTNAP